MFKRTFTVILCMIALVLPLFSARQPLFVAFADRYYVSYVNGSTQPQSVGKSEFLFLSALKGESVFVEKNSFSLQEFLQYFNAKIVLEEQIEEGISYYAYSPKIKYRACVNEKTVNLHVFIAEDYVALGAPIIFGSF